MKALVLRGEIAIPRQVINEMKQARHHDGPEIWTLGVADHLQYPKDCSIDNHVRVMTTVGDRLVDVDAEGDPADPYVLALALDLVASDAGQVTVVTDDHIDRPPMISLLTAATELGLDSVRLEYFLALTF